MLYTNTEKGWTYHNHKHPLFEVLYCESGLMSEWVNGVEYRLEAGDFILINSGALHYPQAHEDSQYFNFHFDVEPREVHSIFHGLRKPIASAEQPADIRREIRSWMERSIALFSTEGGMGFTQKMQLQSNMLQFLAFLLDRIVVAAAEDGASDTLSQRQIAAEAAYLLETHGGSDSVKISELASRLNVHRNYVTSCFKRYYGMTPKHYLMKVRIEKAKRMLQESTLSVNDIAEELMFSSCAYFCKFFRTHVGITPQKYRAGAFKA